MSKTTIEWITEDDDGYEVTHHLPAKFEVCDRCRGMGTHVNPAVDGDGIPAHEFAEDPDFAEEYFSGVYDVPCHECDGQRVVKRVDWAGVDADLAEKYREHLRDEAHFQAMVEAERKFGA